MESVVPVCRICLNVPSDYIDFQARFECSDGNEMSYLQCLRMCTNLPIEEDDNGPQCLCAGCEAELQVVYKFLQKAQNSQAILEENLQINNSNKEIFEHTEILIEKCDTPENLDNDIEQSLKEDLSDYEELSNESNEEISNFFEEQKNMSEDEDIAKIEEIVNNECDANESSHQNECLPENPKTSQNRERTFILKKYECHICNRFYSTERLLKVHLNYHKRRNVGSKPYSCKICGEPFSLQRYLTQHMIEHQDCREIHKCQYCDKEYVSKTALNSHKRIHQGEALNCTECGKQFNGSYEFSVHLRFHKREKEQRVNKCEICNKEYSSSRYLSQHMVVHLNDRKAHKCSYCNKEYVTKTALNNHKRLHEGQTLKCKECGKQFTRNCELKIHMRFHKREHPFKCTICDKEFTIKGQLRTHMWQHQRIKLECEECGKLFGSTKALNEHSYTHGEMPYPCEFCDKGYPSKQKYKIHLEKMHFSEGAEIDLSQIKSLQNRNNLKISKNFTYVQIISEDEENEHT